MVGVLVVMLGGGGLERALLPRIILLAAEVVERWRLAFGAGGVGVVAVVVRAGEGASVVEVG